MKKKYFFAFTLFFPLFVITQNEGSGTITFNASTTAPITATATSLFDNGAYVYQISGNTNEAIAFTSWVVNGTLSNTDDLFFDNVFIPKNPSSTINIFIKADNIKEITAKVYDINGKLVSTPEPINSNNGIVQLYDPMRNLSDGMYFVMVNNKSQQYSLKFIKKGNDETKPIALSQNTSNRVFKAKENKKAALRVMANNYIITWNNTGYGIYGGSHSTEVLAGNVNAFTINPKPVVGTENGDFAINNQLNGSPKINTTITVTNTIVTDSTYTLVVASSQGIFPDAYISNSNNPTSYQVDVISNLTDPDFLPSTFFIDIFQDVAGEINGAKTVELTPIPNEVDLTIIVRHYQTTATMPGVIVELRNASTDAVIGSQVTDANGAVTFQNVPGETTVYTIIDKADDTVYKKTNENYTTKLVNTVGKMTDTINTTAVPKAFYQSGTQFPLYEVMGYKPQSYNVEFLRYSDEIYLPEDSMRPITISQLQNFANAIGYPNAFDFSATQALNQPTATQNNQYQIFLPNRVTFDGQIGTNATYVGTTTNNDGKVADNGKFIYFWSPTFNLSGTQENRNHHEAGNKLGIPFYNNPGGNSRNALATDNIRIQESEMDRVLIKLWYNIGDNIYIRVDTANRPLDYSHTSLLEN